MLVRPAPYIRARHVAVGRIESTRRGPRRADAGARPRHTPPTWRENCSRWHRRELDDETRGRMTLWEINRISAGAFTTALGGIFEHSPWVAETASAARPFAGIAELHDAMMAAVRAAPDAMQLALIRAHPELAGKAAIRGELTPDSTLEQSRAGLNQCSADELARLDRAQCRLQRQVRLPVHPGRQRLRPRGHPARVHPAHRARPGRRARREPGADRPNHAVPAGRPTRRVTDATTAPFRARRGPARSESPSSRNWR